MFQFLRGVALITAIIVNTGAVFAEPDINSANYIMPGCRDFIAYSKQNLLGQGDCYGRIQGLSFALAGDGILGVGRICSSSNVTADQDVRVVVQYIESRPARLHESFNALAVEALLAAWPCKN